MKGFEKYLHFCSSYHGNISSLVDVSSKSFKRLPQGKKEFVHVIPLPRCQKMEDNTAENGSCSFKRFRVIPLIFQLICCTEQANQDKFCEDAQRVIENASKNGRPIGILMSEIVISAAGLVIPPLGYYKTVYQ